MVKRLAFNGLAILALAASGSVNAAEKIGFYLGAGIGQAALETDDSVDFDGDDTGFKLFAGYTFNRYVSLEAAYMDGGTPNQDLGNGQTLEFEITGFNVSAVGTLPLTDTFSVFGRLGFTSYDTEARLTGLISSASAEGGDNDVAYGAGAVFNLNDVLSLRAEYELLDISEIIDDSDVGADSTFLSISGVYRF